MVPARREVLSRRTVVSLHFLHDRTPKDKSRLRLLTIASYTPKNALLVPLYHARRGSQQLLKLTRSGYKNLEDPEEPTSIVATSIDVVTSNGYGDVV
ncbi:hypothetical protein EVAR_28573_1 [Eumeta japonica]|uniref:Uncharacterized protein n=1 Tax=Eumeta variegata TaxID=151549 RepID=A0A4C1UYA6_EUMVA|nr:hypothetical protein EVAR_28573_1 [Eumeta japonica]